MLEALAPGLYRYAFQAMASPCELLVDTDDAALAQTLGGIARDEALRIERKWSRYRDDGVVHEINTSEGRVVEVDDETAGLIGYGALLCRISEGRFDLTAGVLRRAWRFDGQGRWPAPDTVEALRRHVGWSRVDWDGRRLRLQPGMELDLGGLGKEYAVDRALQLVQARADCPVLVNFGGDLATGRPRRNGAPWQVGILESDRRIALRRGAVATSGSAFRHIEHEGRRYPHILDARSGYPVADAPSAVTVAAETCSGAGSLSTLAMLHGARARDFLDAQGADYHIQP